MDKKQKEIEIKSLRERVLLHEEVITDLYMPQFIEYTPYNGQEKYDAKWIDINDSPRYSFNVLAEVKVRTSAMTWPTYMIEKDKYDYLMSRGKEFTEILYINIFEEGYIVWDLKNHPPLEWEEMMGQADNTSNNQKIKIAQDLLTEYAKVIVTKKIDINEAYKKAERLWNKRNSK